jgi:hypothetical protein
MTRRLNLGLILVVLVALGVLIFGGAIGRALVAAAIDAGTGERVAFDAMSIGGDTIVLRNVVVTTAAGEPVLDADRMLVGYRLRDLFPGGSHRFGLESLELDRPRAHLIRHADGSFNLTPASPGGTQPSSHAAGGGAPLRFALTVRDGSVELSDPNRAIAFSRDLSVGAIEATAAIDTSASTRYRLAGNVSGFADQRLSLSGRIDASGYALHRLQARSIAIAPIADYFINNRSAALAKGIARDVDLRAYAFGDPKSSGAYHFAGGALLDDGELRVPGLLVPASAMRGRIDLLDDGIFTPGMSASLGPVAVRLAGGFFAWGNPQFRLGVTANAPLASVRELFGFSQHLPLAGAAHLDSLLEGSAGSPLVATSVTVPQASYGAFPVSDVSGRAIYYASAVEVVGARGMYGGLLAQSDGAVELGAPHTTLVVSARGPADWIPYAAQLAPGADVHATALLEGDGLRFDARGVGGGASRDASFSGLFHVDPDGDGAFGPIRVARSDGATAAGAFYLDRSHGDSAFWADAQGYPYARVASGPQLPGLTLVAPAFTGRLDGSAVGAGPPSDFRIAADLHARAFEVANVRVDDARAAVAGRFGNLHLGAFSAHGAWGDFRGAGDYLGTTLALAGTYGGSFAQLRTFTGDVHAQGPVAGPVALLISPERTIVQARDDRSAGATVRGVPVDALSGTLAVTDRHVRVYSATADVAGGALAAAGSIDANGGVGVSVAGADAARLHALTPLPSGRIAAIGRMRSAANATQFDGGLAVGEASYDRLPLGANGDVRLAGAHLDVSHADTLIGPALGSFGGTLDGLGTGAQRYHLGVHVTAMRLAPVAQAVVPSRSDIAGTLTGDLDLRGSPRAFSLAGSVGIPEGTVNGLAFADTTFDVAVDPALLEIRHGRVTVGSTRVHFGVSAADEEASMHVVSHGADLADFNDYFDAGDTLGGKGNLDVHFRRRNGALHTNAALDIAALRFRRFDLGDARAQWTSSGPMVTGAVAFGGASGRLEAAGTLDLPARAPLAKLLERSSFSGNAKLRGLDLGVWLPALGYQLPVSGRVDADAAVTGPLRDPNVQTTATLADGTLGKFPVDRLQIAATSTLRRTTVTRAELDLPSLTMTGSGSFGLRPRDPLAFSLHAKSPDIAPLAVRLLSAPLPLQGAAEADLKISGTRARPKVVGGFDLEQATFHGVAIPQALGEVSVSGRDIVLSDAEVGFAKGTLYLAGSVPLVVEPFGFGPAAAPITLDFNAKGIDLANFAPLLPQGSTLQGVLDGHVALGGTAGNPRLDGSLALAGGVLRAPFETVPLTAIGARLSFAGSGARLESLHADAGGGTLDATGNILFANLVRPTTDAAYRFDARASRLSLDVPAFVTGSVDGTLSLAHEPDQLPSLAAKLALSDATIPFSALLVADTGSTGFDASTIAASATGAAPGQDVALALDLTAGRNVRVRSANVDIGARGQLAVTGTRSAPVLDGRFDSTGGTLSYFNTVFRLLDGAVVFRPDLGVIPNLDASAVTHVQNPDPNTVRNVTGTADVTLDMHGPVTNLTIGLSSDPNYDRQQILGLLLSAPALGASNLFGDTRGSATLYGSTTPQAPVTNIAGTRNPAPGEFSVAEEAFGIANAQFTRTLLAPVETSIAGAIGLTNINVNVDYTGNVGLTARKVLGKQVNAIYGTSFGYPYRQTFGFEIKPNNVTAAQVTVFQTLGAYGADSLTPTTYLGATTSRIQAGEPSAGTAGFSISLQRLFW